MTLSPWAAGILTNKQLRSYGRLYRDVGPAKAEAHLDGWLAWASRSKLRSFVRLDRTAR